MPDELNMPSDGSGTAKKNYNLPVVLLLSLIAVLLVYQQFSNFRSESCAKRIGETALVGTKAVVDAQWTFFNGCRVKVRDQSHLIFSHLSASEADPDEWQEVATWNILADLGK